MKKYELRISPQIDIDLDEIKNFIAKDSFECAKSIVQEIVIAINSLSTMPNRGANLSNRISFATAYKYLIVQKHYGIFYRINGDEVIVTRVVHLARNLKKLKLE